MFCYALKDAIYHMNSKFFLKLLLFPKSCGVYPPRHSNSISVKHETHFAKAFPPHQKKLLVGRNKSVRSGKDFCMRVAENWGDG